MTVVEIFLVAPTPNLPGSKLKMTQTREIRYSTSLSLSLLQITAFHREYSIKRSILYHTGPTFLSQTNRGEDQARLAAKVTISFLKRNTSRRKGQITSTFILLRLNNPPICTFASESNQSHWRNFGRERREKFARGLESRLSPADLRQGNSHGSVHKKI